MNLYLIKFVQRFNGLLMNYSSSGERYNKKRIIDCRLSTKISVSFKEWV